MDMVHIDLLLEILRRLPPRSLAVSRCACTAWRAAIDHHRLLRADLLPLSVDAAVYDERSSEEPARLFGRPSTARHITSNLEYLADNRLDVRGVQDHCNGLFLTHGWMDEFRVKVVNIATRQWAPLPLLPCACSWPPAMCGRCRNNRYLVYDPTISPHYKVLYIPRILADTTCAEWPPTPYVMYVFSSRTDCWKETSFVREGAAAGTADDVNSCSYDPDEHMHYAAYWQGSLYVPSPRIKDDFLLRINLSSDKYQLIKLPKGRVESHFRLDKWKKGVYCVMDTNVRCTFRVWFLHESCGLTDWVLKNEINLEPAFTKQDWHYGPWIPQPPEHIQLLLKSNINLKLADEYNEAVAKDGFDWDSDDEDLVSITDWPKKCDAYIEGPYCLGFHPYKEIVFFNERGVSPCSMVAYHLNSSRIRYLGNMRSRCHYSMEEVSFAYTPCWMMDLPGSN
ncbi:uncharacterized protein LOC119312965 [Triticum dicoccoides]|uniref:uncharacterized protein LOC119312965 n=1 Tax=Triticum dicoccoides TaxID=85692 RepID=UPI00188DE068|nr:uncharacterized protein LOC119312965 [Triticum dicoccoides]